MARRLTRAVVLVALACLAMNCGSNRRSLVRRPRASAPLLKGVALDLAGRDVRTIAHRAGACDLYPTDLLHGIPEKPTPAADLLESSEVGGFDGVEIDVHADPEGATYVSHEPMDLTRLGEVLVRKGIDPAWFMRRNRLAEAAIAYLASHPGGHLFIELKAPRRDDQGVTEEDRRLARAVLADLARIRERLGEPALQRITFISWMLGALRALYEGAQGAYPDLGYHLILGTDNFLFHLFGNLPSVGSQLELLRKREGRFISGVWFSLAILHSPEQVLRQAHEVGGAKLFSDAYVRCSDTLRNDLARLSRAGIEVSGLVFDAVADPLLVDGTLCPP